MLDKVIGNKTAKNILIHVYHYGEIHASAIAQDYDMSLTAVLHQLDRLEDAGVLVSKVVGRSRLYQFNLKSPYTKPLKEMVKISYDTLPIEKKQMIFQSRRRPRQKRKPIR